ncbi:MAG: DNA repair protein RecO [Kofleriaceae bacterium]
MSARAATSTLGVLLRSQPYRDADLIVTLFTEALGKVSALARAARRSQRRFAGALGALVLGSFQLTRAPRSELWTLETATAERSWLELSGDMAAVAHASYVLELTRELLPAEAPEPSVLALILELWDALREGPSPAALRLVEWRLLAAAGTPPALEVCAACGAALDDEPVCLFDPRRGGAMCRRCAAEGRGAGARVLSTDARRYLASLASAETIAAARALEAAAPVDAADRAAARDAMIAMIQVLVPRPLKTVEFIAKVSKPTS